MSNCNKCYSSLSATDTVIKCDSCKASFHTTCTKLTRAEVSCLRQKDKVVEYFCDKCKAENQSNKKLLSIILDLQNEIKSLKSEVSELQNKIDIKHHCVAERSDNLSLVEEVLRESHEREKRSKNIILFNVDEETQSILTVAKDIISHASDDVKTDNIKVYRVGKKIQNKNRPIKIELESATEAKSVLKNKAQIKEPYQHIKINNDQTFLQRKYLKQLREKLIDMNDNDNKRYGIKYVYGVPTIVESSESK